MIQSVSQTFKKYVTCGGYAESTIDSKLRAMRFFYNAFGDMGLSDITYGHAEDYLNILRQGGRGAKTVNLYVIHLAHFFGWAVKRQYLRANPFFGLKLLPEETRKLPSFSDEEIIRLINVADIRFRVLICLGLLGLREGEALNLHRDDLDFDKGHIFIRSKQGGQTTWPWRIKNRKQAYAPLPETIVLPDMIVPLRPLVLKLVASIPPNQPYVCVIPTYYAKLIKRYHEGQLHYRKMLCPWGNFDRDFKALQKKAWIAPLKSFHDLRRNFANKLRKNGYDLKDVQTLMRHSSITTTTKFYLSVNEEELVARANRTFSHYVSNVP